MLFTSLAILGAALQKGTIGTIESFHFDSPGKGFDVRITYPEAAGRCPIIVWSHGLGGSKDAYGPLVGYWAAHGYVVIQPTHADSLTLAERPGRPSTSNWSERPAQISAILDRLPTLERQLPALRGKIDEKRVLVGGHSFGAHTAQLVAGTKLRGFLARGKSFEDKRPVAFIWISPQGTGPMISSQAWSEIRRPVLMISGDNDANPVTGQPASWRKEVWEGLAPGDKYLLWVKDAYHGFGGISGRVRFPGSGEANENQVRDVQLATTAFLDAFLKRDLSAKGRLDGGLKPLPAPATLTKK